jgi:hypothetical protein
MPSRMCCLHADFVVVLTSLRAEGLLVSKMHAKVRKDLKKVATLRLQGCHLPQLRSSAGIRLRVRGDDFQHHAKCLSTSVGESVEWRVRVATCMACMHVRMRRGRAVTACAVQSDMKMHCKHAYTEHIRGRLLHFKVSYDGGNGRSRRTIGQAALPLMVALPAHPPPGWPQGYTRDEWPFSIPLYHGCALTACMQSARAARTPRARLL